MKAEKDQAESESGELKFELSGFKEQLSEKDEAVIISKFKESTEYDQAIANAGASDIQPCWLVAERHIKTNPGAN